MNKNIILSSIAIVALTSLIGCGSSSSGDSTTTGHLIDSAVSGVSYSCGDKNGTTDNKGTFTCKSLPVTFSVGSVQLGTISSLPSDGKIYPQDLAGVARGDINNTKVKNLAQFFQSLDKDHNPSNGITIDSTLASKVKKNITDWEGVDMEAYLYSIDPDMHVVSRDDAVKHLGEQFVTTPPTTNNTNNNTDISKSKTFTPPSWIQGTWMDRATEPNLPPTGWRFTKNDVYSIMGKYSVSGMKSVKSGDYIKQEITSTMYKYTIVHTSLNSTEGPFTFKKVGDSQIQLIDSLGNIFPPCTKE